jgi:hypothetical protein
MEQDDIFVPACIRIQFRTLTIYIRPEEQIQERLCLKKSTTSLLVVIGALDSPLGSHSENNLAIDLYSVSTPIANMDESDRQISLNRFKNYVTSLSTVIGASNSPLGPNPENNLATDLYTGSTLIAIMDESNRRFSFIRLQEIYITTGGDQVIRLSFRNPSKNRSRYRFILVAHVHLRLISSTYIPSVHTSNI